MKEQEFNLEEEQAMPTDDQTVLAKIALNNKKRDIQSAALNRLIELV